MGNTAPMYMLVLCMIGLTIMLSIFDYKGKVTNKVSFVIMFVLMGFVTRNEDFYAYLRLYRSIDDITKIGLTDPGFGILMYLGNALNLDYYTFLKIITILFSLALIYVLKIYCNTPAIALSIYLIILFPVMTVQLRAFISEIIIYAMLLELITSKELSIRKILILLVASTLFHSISIFFIIMLITLYIRDSKSIFAITLVSIISIPITTRLVSYIPIPMIQQKSEVYLNLRTSTIGSGMIVYLSLYILLLVCILYILKKNSSEIWNSQLRNLLNINILTLLAVALVITFNSNYYRIIRVIIMVDIIVILNYLFSTSRFTKTIQVTGMIVLPVLLFVYNYSTQSIMHIINNNALFVAIS